MHVMAAVHTGKNHDIQSVRGWFSLSAGLDVIGTSSSSSSSSSSRSKKAKHPGTGPRGLEGSRRLRLPDF